jgi:putative transposase
MSQTLSNVLIHFVYSTKNRGVWLKDADHRKEMYKVKGKILQDFDCHPILINGVEDHVHIFCDFTRNYTIKKVIGEIKTGTSKWIKTMGSQYSDFHWQSGYGAFSVSQSKRPALFRYIQNQEEHHRVVSYQDEFRRLCELHGVAIDERYVWD